MKLQTLIDAYERIVGKDADLTDVYGEMSASGAKRTSARWVCWAGVGSGTLWSKIV
jgi:hypothetical protein